MGRIDEYLAEEDVEAKYQRTVKLINSFVSKYTFDAITNLSLEEYFYAGHEETFYHRLSKGLERCASMGDLRPAAFGIRIDSNNKIVMNPGLTKLYGNDYKTAFDRVKKEIVKFLSDDRVKGRYFIDRSIIYQNVQFKLLSVYYPGKFFPVCTENPTTNNYCEVFNIDKSGTMLDKNIRLVEWSRQHLPAEWKLYHAMAYCDWLVRHGKKDDGSYMPKEAHKKKAEKIEKEIERLELTGEEREAVVKQRVNQGVFRDSLLALDKRCKLCCTSNEHLLIASHIKPWSESEPGERLDDDNGFLMCPNHDKLFDNGFITFDDEGYIMISSQLSESDRICMNIHEDMQINLSEGNRKYLEYHRTNKFKG